MRRGELYAAGLVSQLINLPGSSRLGNRYAWDLVVRDEGRPGITRRGLSFKGVVKAVGNVSIPGIAVRLHRFERRVCRLSRQGKRSSTLWLRPSEPP